MARILIVRCLVVAMLFGNAIATGLCAALCQARVCCAPAVPGISAKATAPPCCSHCKAAKKPGGAICAASHQDDCCAWIGKKVDPAAAVLKALAALDNHVIALPAVPAVTQAAVSPGRTAQILSEDRAPPDPARSLSQPRAPPIASM